MNKINHILKCMLFAVCMVLVVIIAMQRSRLAKLREAIESLESGMSRQEITADVPAKKSLPSNETKAAKKSSEVQAVDSDKVLKRQNRKESKELEERFAEVYPNGTMFLSLEQFKEENAAAYESFMLSRKGKSKSVRERYAKRLALFKCLDPKFLSEKKFEFLQDEIRRQLKSDEYRLAFKMPPPELGRIRFKDNDDDDDVSEMMHDTDRVISEYCANAVGIPYNAIESREQLERVMALEEHFFFVHPIVNGSNTFQNGR